MIRETASERSADIAGGEMRLRAPQRTIAVKHAIQLHAVRRTSSPGPTPIAASATSSAPVPLLTPSA